MNVVLWIIASLLAAVFLANGLLKLTQPKEKLAASAMTRWAEDFSPNAIKAMGTLQVAAAIGLTLPALLNIAPVFVPLAALGLAAMMIGAAIVHTAATSSRCSRPTSRWPPSQQPSPGPASDRTPSELSPSPRRWRRSPLPWWRCRCSGG